MKISGFKQFAGTAVLLVLLAYTATPAGPSTAPVTPDTSKVVERDRLLEEVFRLWDAGKPSEAAEAGEKVLALERQIYGVAHPEVAERLGLLAELYEEAGARQSVVERRKQQVQVRTALDGAEHWRTTDARLALRRAEQETRMAPVQQRRLAEAAEANRQVVVLYLAGRYREAVEVAKRVLATRRELLGEEDLDTAASLNNLAELHRSTGAFAKALPLHERALAVCEKALGPDHPQTAMSLNNLAALHSSTGAYAKALPLYERALAIHEKALGPNHPDTAMSLNNLAELHRLMGAYAKALPLYERALAICEKALGPEHPDTATSLSSLAGLHESMGDYDAALPLYERALAIHEKALVPDHPSTATSLSSLAGLHESMGAYAKALPLYERALAIRERALGPDHPSTATSLSSLAGLHESTGAYAKALPLYERALVIREKALGPDHPTTATSLNNLAEFHRLVGAYAKALPLHEKALAIWEKALGPDHPDTAISLNNLALLHWSMGAYAKALPLYERALVIREKALGPDHPSTAQSLNNLAVLHRDMGAYAKALPLCERALTIWEKALGPDHPDTATSLSNLALLHRLMRAYDKALPLDERALAIHEKALGSDHPDTAQSLKNLALLQADLGRIEQALDLSSRAAAIVRASLESTASVQSEQQQLALAGSKRWSLDTLLSLSALAGSMADQTYGETLAWKGAVSARQRQMRAMRQAVGTDAGTAKVYTDLESAARRLATLQGSTPGAGAEAVAKHRRNLQQLSGEVERLQRELATRSVAYRQELARQRRTPDQLAAALPKDAVLVDVLEYDHYTPASQKQKTEGSRQRRLVAFVLRRDQPVVRVDLGAAQEIADLIDGWRLTFGAGDAGKGAGVELRQRLWEPLLPHLGEAKTVVVSPDGALCRLPLGALPGKEPGNYLLEEVAIVVVPVPQMLPELFKQQSGEAGSLLLVGDVDFGEMPEGPGTRPATPASVPLAVVASAAGPQQGPQRRFVPRGATTQRWEQLDATFDEATAIQGRFQRRFRGMQVDFLAQQEATEQSFRDKAPHARFIHLATHGYFAPPEVKSALDQPTTRPAELAMDRERPVTGYHPGLLSGIVLSGANVPPANLEMDDGILTALEIGELDLGKVDLAVLSACQTGLGQTAGGEGLLGLQRGFQIAGAKTVVASLWTVPDRATQALMSEFYRNLWEKKLPKGEALRQAQIWMLREAPRRGLDFADPGAAKPDHLPPYYWAAFTLSGDWR